ncbi:MAG: CoA pyrophosphatase [Balneolaceae bacterium]|nr:MAG: CoA pyrophosphatase [Balneolaceae bacterium]
MDKHPFYHFLKNRSESSLPGREAQMKMAPIPLDPEFVLPHNTSETAHPSGVLIPIFPDNENNLHVILTLRTNSIRHAGQISFPGGRRENDETLAETALRETEEEIGIAPSKVDLACCISPLYLYRTDNQITPFVGFLNDKPALTPNPAEVEEAFTASLEQLISPKYQKREEWHLTHASFDVPYWNIHRVPLWGATAMMMSELLELYGEFRKGLNE